MSSVSILYEDDDVLVIDKPAGLVVHSDGRTDEPTVVDWVLKNYPSVRGVGDPMMNYELGIRNYDKEGNKDRKKKVSIHNSQFIIPNSAVSNRSGIVHRLDRDTSGALVIAKNQKAFEFLKKQFQEREMEKSYRAFVYGVVKNDEGIIDRPIARSGSDFRKWSATRGARGKERQAVTEYKVLGRIPPTSLGSSTGQGAGGATSFSFLELRPKTGRTHQIRVHLKAINHPVVCDTLYAPKREAALGFTRLALHAFSISFTLPSGKRVTVSAPLPEDFEEAIKILNQ